MTDVSDMGLSVLPPLVAGPYKSTQPNAGQHSNVHYEPKSVLDSDSTSRKQSRRFWQV